MPEAEKQTYADQLQTQFRQIIDGLALSDLQKRFLRDRWLDQLLWFEEKSGYNQRRYYAVRLSQSPRRWSHSSATARWRTFRRTTETLKTHGWQFFELAGPYAAPDHATCFPAFAAQVETLVQQDVETFIAQAAHAQAAKQTAGG